MRTECDLPAESCASVRASLTTSSFCIYISLASRRPLKAIRAVCSGVRISELQCKSESLMFDATASPVLHALLAGGSCRTSLS